MLDQYQTNFCLSEARDIRLLAPAGSGKTHSLLHRCKAVADRTEGKAKFLVVTFTRAARDELRARLGHSPFEQVVSSTEVTTLNSWGWRRVRERHHSPKLLAKRERNFAVQNSLQPVWRKYDAIQKAMEKKPIPTGKLLLAVMDQLKNLAFDHSRHTSPESVAAHYRHLEEAGAETVLPALANDLYEADILSSPAVDALLKEFIPFWRDAVESLIQQSVFTLEDQKYVAYINARLQLEEGRLPLGGSKFSDILVDEFQDISPLDLALIRIIADLHRAGLTIVGDDDQAIFEWRGASPSYILDPDRWFERKFDTFILERNYRCPKNIVDHSQRLIRNNQHRYPKRVEARNLADAKIDIVQKDEFTQSIDSVLDQVSAFVEDSNNKGERIALVSRKRAQLIPYQIMLAQRNIPFCAAEDLQVFLSETFETLLEMLSSRMEAGSTRIANRVVDDVLSLCDRIKRFPLSKADKAQLRSHLLAGRPRTVLNAVKLLSEYKGRLKGDNEGRAMSLAFSEALESFYASENVCEAIEAISEHFAGMSKDYGKAEEDIFFSDPPFFYLSKFAERYDDEFELFVEDIQNAAATLAQVPSDDDPSDDAWSRPVHLMTALRAKGKEFHTVVLLDVNNGIWPSQQAESRAQIESERRVFYVALTRAKARLLVTISGRIGTTVALPSPFLAEAGMISTLV